MSVPHAGEPTAVALRVVKGVVTPPVPLTVNGCPVVTWVFEQPVHSSGLSSKATATVEPCLMPVSTVLMESWPPLESEIAWRWSERFAKASA